MGIYSCTIHIRLQATHGVRAGRADRGEQARDARGMRVILASMARGGERGARGASAERITRENTAQPNRHSNSISLLMLTLMPKCSFEELSKWFTLGK